ncbi:uncharacterized protein CTRU02_213169 [Colletotrichum truncatum]|uniref:Uncharacterized protein n=1 Tax=Colletotrichum truncatum TaxID=5467 RepID=A0ACC3YJZ8_COLTU|nr:uncharacterized protein CTRU02_03487 [Colletotrichum truncatum]KAF6797456.1 hypothetical protein CTRU02_03487 [Colletotrichum truncatum]
MSKLPPNHHPLDCTYNRDDVVAGLTQYYLALTSMAYIPASYIDFPPPGGWTDMELDIGALRALQRSEKVIDLLRHLPYPRAMQDGPRPGPWNVAPQSKAVRYLRHMGDFCRWSDRGDAGLLELAALQLSETPAGPMNLPPDVVALTFGDHWKPTASTKPFWWIVDCGRGVISPFQERVYSVGKVPRNKPWRTAQSYPAANFFAQLLAELGSNLIPVPPTEELDADVLSRSSLHTTEPWDIYQRHGWPGETFRHDECIIALQAYRRRVHEEEQHRISQDVDDADDEDFEMEDSDDDMEQDVGTSGLEDAVADMEVDDLSAEAAALRADMSPEERERFDRHQLGNQLPFDWIDSE